MGVCHLKENEKLLLQWDKNEFDIFSPRIRFKGNLGLPSGLFCFYLFDLINISSKEKNSLDALSGIDIFSESDAYLNSELKYHFLLRKFLLRLVLSNYVNKRPFDVVFKTNFFGKPYIDRSQSKIFFNFSHTSEYGFLGISKKSEIGTDIEKIKTIDGKNSLLEIFASPKETTWVLGDINSNIRFFILWTCKESLLKAKGTGFLESPIPRLTMLPRKTENGQYESSFKNYKMFSQVDESLKLVFSICLMES